MSPPSDAAGAEWSPGEGSQSRPGADGWPEMVDWGLAVATARRLAGNGPTVSATEAAEVVADLRRFSAQATVHVHRYTGLDGSAGQAPVLIVDRGGWSQANADGMRELTGPIVARLRAAQRAGGSHAGVGLADGIGPKVTGLETGALLAFLSAKVLGQYDPFYSGEPGSPPATGRLLLVAPNIVAVERELAVDARDFRLWVCLHEETHRVQFTAVPWLRDHLRSEIAAFIEATDIDPRALLGRIGELVRGVLDALRSPHGDGPSLAELLQTPQQRAIVERITAVMSLLEGHADVVMDDVGPEVVPSVATIRARFARRRAGASGLDRSIRRMLGLEAKMRQYREGSAFVRYVLDRTGMHGLNQVWTSPQTLPTMAEIHDPAAWVARVPERPALPPAG